MPAAEFQQTKRFTVLNTRENVYQQIKEALDTAYPIKFVIESEIGNQSELTIFLRFFTEADESDDLLFATSERHENVTVFIPKNPQEPAIAVLPN